MHTGALGMVQAGCEGLLALRGFRKEMRYVVVCGCGRVAEIERAYCSVHPAILAFDQI